MKNILRFSVNLVPPGLRRHVARIPFIAGLQRWLVRRLLSDERFVHKINAGPAKGLRIEVELPRDKAIWTGNYEFEFATILRSLVRPGQVFFDVGGFRGYMSGIAALAGAGRIIVFEPLPSNVAALRNLLALNPGVPIQIDECALGDREGQVEFSVMPDDSMGKVFYSPFQPDARPTTRIRVPIATLDTLVFQKGYPAPDLVKIDVEGAEVSVLQGATNLLARHRPQVLIEAHSLDLESRCRILLETLGYTVRRMEKHAIPDDLARHLVCT